MRRYCSDVSSFSCREFLHSSDLSKTVAQTSSALGMLPGPAESTSHGNLVKNTNSQALTQFDGIRNWGDGWGLDICVLVRPHSDSGIQWSLRTTTTNGKKNVKKLERTLRRTIKLKAKLKTEPTQRNQDKWL